MKEVENQGFHFVLRDSDTQILKVLKTILCCYIMQSNHTSYLEGYVAGGSVCSAKVI